MRGESVESFEINIKKNVHNINNRMKFEFCLFYNLDIYKTNKNFHDNNHG